MTTSLVIYIYAACVAAIGLAGYSHLPSLLAGLISGAILALAGWMLQKGRQQGFLLAVVVSAGLMLMAAGRFASSGQVWPMGVLAPLSLVALIGIIITAQRRTPRSR